MTYEGVLHIGEWPFREKRRAGGFMKDGLPAPREEGGSLDVECYYRRYYVATLGLAA